MFFKKQGFPQEGEVLLCTVTSVQYHSVFVRIDEYDKTGMIHISEVSPGRIRNIRDFVKEGKKVVCKVLRIHADRGHIDLTLRRVTESEKRAKIEWTKKEQHAEKIIEQVATKNGIAPAALYTDVSTPIFSQYTSLSECFDDFVQGNISLADAGIPQKYVSLLEESIRQRIKPPEVIVRNKFKITTYEPSGIELIKECFKKIEAAGKEAIAASYLGSGTYHITVKASDYKTAEKIFKQSTQPALAEILEHDAIIEQVKE